MKASACVRQFETPHTAPARCGNPLGKRQMKEITYGGVLTAIDRLNRNAKPLEL